ncbi:DMT family transporter [Streptomyces adustus]|uniref:DMT family transporter n=1 Tax=Streptomyces adustus TaxID=1609272 RepID=A0A5N8VCH0_9ACTN|nr:DMT family transporter [Streptomyces adustus]
MRRLYHPADPRHRCLGVRARPLRSGLRADGVRGGERDVRRAAGGLDLIPPDRTSWYGVLWTAVLATAAALVVQTWAQTRLSPERAAVIMTLEPVFAAAFRLFAGQTMSVRQTAGCALVLLAMFVVDLPGRGARSDVETAATSRPDPGPGPDPGPDLGPDLGLDPERASFVASS